MSRLTKFNNVLFLDHGDEIPENMEEGVLYIVESWEMARFKCPCGCGNDIILPIMIPWGWDYTRIDDKVTLSPAIKPPTKETINPNNPDKKYCNSHYQIVNNEIIWKPDDIKADVIIDINIH